MQVAPRGLMSVQAELLFLEGQLVYHWRDAPEKGGGEHFKFVSPDQAARAFQQQAVDTGWLPQGLVRWGSSPAGSWLVKFIPPQYHTLTFTALNMEHFKELGEVKKDLAQVTVPLPALIFAGTGETYFVWAIKGKLFDARAKLYHAPVPNLYGDGKVCFGQNKPPQAGWESIEKTWKLFIEETPFNADLTRDKSVKHPADIRKQLIAVAKQAEKASKNALAGGGGIEYPASDLVPLEGRINAKAGLTLDEAVKRFLKANKE